MYKLIDKNDSSLVAAQRLMTCKFHIDIITSSKHDLARHAFVAKRARAFEPSDQWRRHKVTVVDFLGERLES